VPVERIRYHAAPRCGSGLYSAILQHVRIPIHSNTRNHDADCIVVGVINIVSTAKVGKSWLGSDLCLSVVNGASWMGFKCRKPGAVLLVDNELPKPTIADRHRRIVEARGYDKALSEKSLLVLSLRENPLDAIKIMERVLLSGEKFVMIMIDSLYRSYPAGFNENDNVLMTKLFSLLVQYTSKIGCVLAIIHHSGKGSQLGKSVIDVGRGASSFGGATDCHLTLRGHPDERNYPDSALLEAKSRTFPLPAPRCLKFACPLWNDDPEMTVEDFFSKPARGKNGDAPAGTNGDKPPELSPREFVEKYVPEQETHWKKIYETAQQDGCKFGQNRVKDILKNAAISGFVAEYVGKKDAMHYSKPSGSVLHDVTTQDDASL